MRTGGNYHYFHTDHLGTPQKLTAKGGATTWAANYSGFGAATVNTSTVTNPIRFPGQYFDSETGLHQNFMRDYDPEIGAYLEQDPYGILTGPNRYGYVYGDPVGLSDPTGEFAVTATAIGVGFGVAFFVGDQALNGFPAIKCSQYLWDSCLYADQAQACLSTGGSLVLSLIGGGSVNFGTKIISGIAGKIVKRFGGFGRLGGFLGRFGDDALQQSVPLLETSRESLIRNVTDQRLRNAIDNLFRKGAKIGNGSTMDAVRYERATGHLLSRKGHTLKLIERRTQLQKLLRDSKLNASDRKVVKDLLIDIQDALNS